MAFSLILLTKRCCLQANSSNRKAHTVTIKDTTFCHGALLCAAIAAESSDLVMMKMSLLPGKIMNSQLGNMDMMFYCDDFAHGVGVGSHEG
jgi:hypothetical protein